MTTTTSKTEIRDAALLRAAADILAQLSTPYRLVNNAEDSSTYWVGIHAPNSQLYRLADEIQAGRLYNPDDA